MARCFLDPATYQVRVDVDAARRRWRVLGLPHAERACDTYGGGGLYEIDTDTFKIQSFKQFE